MMAVIFPAASTPTAIRYPSVPEKTCLRFPCQSLPGFLSDTFSLKFVYRFAPSFSHTTSAEGTDTTFILKLFMPPERPNGIRLLYDPDLPHASKNQHFSPGPVEISWSTSP
jgi:hypothetical protein